MAEEKVEVAVLSFPLDQPIRLADLEMLVSTAKGFARPDGTIFIDTGKMGAGPRTKDIVVVALSDTLLTEQARQDIIKTIIKTATGEIGETTIAPDGTRITVAHDITNGGGDECRPSWLR